MRNNGNTIKNKRILVTGGAGSIGEELTRQLAPKNKVYILDINDTEGYNLIEELGIKGRSGDIRDRQVIEDVFREFVPDIVFHCAAMKTVTSSEFNYEDTVKTNVFGAINVFLMAKKYGCKLINISTDKVVNADSIMGITKKLAEKIAKRMSFNSVRFGNVMNSNGSVLPIWQKQAEKGHPLTITDARMTRYMMTIPQAVELIIEASKMPQDGRIVILDMGQPVNILELAKSIIRASGRDLGIKMIGIRPGETLFESLMTEEEEKKAKKQGKFFII